MKRKETIMDKNKVLHEFYKNSVEKVVTSFTTYKGRYLLDVRVYYNAGEDEELWKPSPKGLTLCREMIPELKKAVDLAAAEYKKGLPSPEAKGESQEEKVPF
jgi:hypothetical protein